MTNRQKVASLPLPVAAPVSPESVVAGLPIPALERLRLMSAQQWEEFVLEWADSLRMKYVRVERCGGAGDMGRDIIAMSADDREAWDNYQCKHYSAPLTPGDVWCELGKLIYYTHIGAYSCPRRYTFVAPRGAGTKLSKLLKDPVALREGLRDQWGAECQRGITSTAEVPLSGGLHAHFVAFDFSIFDSLPPLRLIEQHVQTRWHLARFGGGLPARPPSMEPPIEPAPQEAAYVRCLLDAYGDHLKRPIATPDDMDAEQPLREHFTDSRFEFYSAESLRTFSRDTLPPGEFEKLQGEVLSGIKDDMRATHPSGYARVLSVVKTARLLPLGNHALHTRLAVRDRGGICHQLANDGKAKWVP